MKPEVKKIWLEALRSGEYKQTDGALRVEEADGPKFCCLGVLCDLHMRATGEDTWKPNDEVTNNRSDYLGNSSILPPEVVEWAGLDANNPTLVGVELKNSTGGIMSTRPMVAELNDEGWSFAQIADAIEQKL